MTKDNLTHVVLKDGKRMKYSQQVIDILFPFLTRKLEEEWELIKEKNSGLSRQQRDKITELCSLLEREK